VREATKGIPASVGAPPAADDEAVKRSVRSFYDSIGWRRADGTAFEDAARYEDLKPASAGYVHSTNLRVRRHIARNGNYLLDVASGPVQFDDFVAFSEGYGKRVCVDLSILALHEARRRLGGHGLFVLGDITRLPFRDDVFDGVCSLHTIYHVPADQQANAFLELARVLARGRSGVVVYAWGKFSPLMFPFDALPHKLAAIARRLGVWGRGRAAEPSLYFSPRSQAWFRRAVAPGMRYEMFVWRSLSNFVLRRYIPDNAFGSALLRWIHWAEERWPRALGWLGNYPLIVIKK
jgi:SAM-dependent methyltransferase